MANILVVDDEQGIRDLLSEILNDEGHSVDLAENAMQARNARQSKAYDLVLLDIWMPDTDGVTLLKEWSNAGLLTMPVIVMSGHASIDTAVEATRFGAFLFLEKPITLQKLLKAVEQALAHCVAISHKKKATADEKTVVDTVAQDSGNDDVGAQAALATKEQEDALALRRIFAFDRPLREARDEFEKAYFEFHLACESGSMTRVAETTGLERTHLYRKLRRLGVDLGRNKRGS